MNIIKLFVVSYLILSTFVEWNIIYCMEEKVDSYEIGARYYEGIGVEKDKVEAAKWFLKAAKENHVTAQFRLAICYELGEGVAQDKVELAKWLQRAAEQGHIIAQFRTGGCYEKGEGVIQDKAEALKWFQKAANQGNLPAKQRVIKLETELFGHSSTADQLNSSYKTNADISKIQMNPSNKIIADKGNSINSTNPITSQSHRKHPRQNNQKQNDQKTLSPEEFKKAEEAARKAMDELIAEEEAELRKHKQTTRGNSKKVRGKGNEGIKKEEKKEPVSTKQITSVKKKTDKPSEDKLGRVSSAKNSVVDKVPTVNHFPQAKKQDNASKGKQKNQRGNAAQATQAVDNKQHIFSLETQKEAVNLIEKEENKKEEETREPVQTAQITGAENPVEKPSGGKLNQASSTKVSIIDKVSTVTHSPQTQKQGNASRRNQKGPLGNTAQTTQAVNDNLISVSPVTQSEATNTIENEGEKGRTVPTRKNNGLKEAPEKPSVDKVGKISNQKISVVDKVPTITPSPQTQKQDNDSKGNQKGQQGNTAQTTQVVNNNRILSYPEKQNKSKSNVWKKKATSINSTADTNDGEKNAVIDTNQLLQADNEPEPINNHQPKPHKQKKPKALWNDVKGMLKKKKPENKDETKKEIKAENNITPMGAPIFYPPIAYPTEHMNGGAGIPYFSGPIHYIQVLVPFPVPVKIPVYIPVPSSFSHVSGHTTQPWVPHTQIKYEDGKKIVTQWNDDGKGSTHVYHPDSKNVELEYSYLDTRFRHLKSTLKTHGSQIDDEDADNMADSTSSRIIYHGGDAAKQKNEELKKKICYLEKLIQEKSLGSSK